eukprot:tig00021094_g18100.t1
MPRPRISRPAAGHGAAPAHRSQCRCAECCSPQPRPWACEYRCACQQCEAARSGSPAAGAAARFCFDFVLHLEGMVTQGPETSKRDLKACVARWRGELEACVAELGEQRLASVALALRLARLLWVFSRDAEAREVYQRFLAPRLLDERRRDELLGASTTNALITHADNYGSLCMDAKDYSTAKKAYAATLEILNCYAKLDASHESVSDTLYKLALSCLGLKERDEAFNNYQLALGLDQDSGDARRLASMCCRADPFLVPIARQFEEAGFAGDAEQILEASNFNFEMCIVDLIRNSASGAFGIFIFRARAGRVRIRSNLGKAQFLLKLALELREDPDLDVLYTLGMLHGTTDRLDEARAYFRRGLNLAEATFGLVHDETERFLAMLYKTSPNPLDHDLTKDPSAAKHYCDSISFCYEKMTNFIKQTGRMPAGVTTGDMTLSAIVKRLEETAKLARLQSWLTTSPETVQPSSPELQTRRERVHQDELEGRRKANARPEAGRGRERARQEAERNERERARREAERAERAKRDAADRNKALDLAKESNWPAARALLDALLERSPGDVAARLLRMQCMDGMGQLEAIVQEAEAWENALVAESYATSSTTGVDRRDVLVKVQRLRQKAERETALRERREAERRADEAARQLLEEEEQERQQEERRRGEAARRAAEKAERRRRAEEERRQAQRRREEEEQSAREQQRQQQQRLAEEREERRRRDEQETADGAPHRTGRCGAASCLAGSAARGGRAGEEPEPACAICLDSEPGAGGPSSPVAPLPCGHRFHARCIATWRASPLGTSCPECRAPFSGTAPDPAPEQAPPAASEPAAPAAAGPSGALELAPAPAPEAPAPAGPLEAAVAAAAMGQLSLAPAPAPAPPSSPPAPGPRPTRPYLPPGGPIVRPTRPYDPFNRGAGSAAGPSQ